MTSETTIEDRIAARVQYTVAGVRTDQIGPWSSTPDEATVAAKVSVAATYWGIKGYPHAVNF